MKLQKTTWILLIIALIFGGFVYFYEIQGKPQREEFQSQKKKLFQFNSEEIKELTIETQKETLKFEKTGDVNQVWRMKQPEEQLANDAVISFLVNLLVDSQSDRSFNIASNQLPEYGLDQPLANITIKLKNQTTHKLILGKSDFKNEFLYAQIDPENTPNQELSITLVPQDFQYAIERDLADWKKPEQSSQEKDSEESPSPKSSATKSPEATPKPSNSGQLPPSQSPETKQKPE